MKKNKGITLIALVVTIIVLLILAAVSINLLFGENGIITKATQANLKNEYANNYEKLVMAAYSALARGNGTINYNDLVEELNIEIGQGKYIITPEDEDEERWIIRCGTASVVIENSGIVTAIDGESSQMPEIVITISWNESDKPVADIIVSNLGIGKLQYQINGYDKNRWIEVEGNEVHIEKTGANNTGSNLAGNNIIYARVMRDGIQEVFTSRTILMDKNQITEGLFKYKKLTEDNSIEGYDGTVEVAGFNPNHSWVKSFIEKEDKAGNAPSEIKNLVIPSEVTINEKTYKVTSIGIRAFLYSEYHVLYRINNNIETLTIPNSIITIEENAFGSCKKLAGSLIIPNSVTSIGDYAFSSCTGFTGNLVIGDSVTTIGRGAFSGNGFTGNLILGDSVEIIGNYAFRGCKGFTGNLIIPDKVTSIGDYAFNECTGFTGNLVLGRELVSIGEYAFWRSTGFTGNLIIPNKVTTIKIFAFEGCTGFTGNLTLGDEIVTIDRYAFANCNFTGGLIIPNKVQKIGDEAFINCINFRGNLVIPNNVTDLGTGAFSKTGFDGTLTLGNGLNNIGTNTFSDCNFTGNLVIPETVQYIYYSAFFNCSGFTGNLIIPDSVKQIGQLAFCKCSGFDGTLTIGNQVNNIQSRAFLECSGFTGNLTIPNTVTTFGDNVFKDCSSFSNVYTYSENIAYDVYWRNLNYSHNIPVYLNEETYTSSNNPN